MRTDFNKPFNPELQRRRTRPAILAVDDDRALLNVLAQSLDAAGFEVVLASDAHSALTILKCSDVHAVIVDVRLIGHSGLEILEYVRSTGEFLHLPVLILTGVSSLNSDEEQIIRSNEAHVLYKAEGIDQVAVALRELMQRQEPPVAT